MSLGGCLLVDMSVAYEGAFVPPQEFLRDVQNAAPGWSEKYGGPEGVALLAASLQAVLAEQSETIASVRAAAIKEQLKTRSGVDVAKSYGLSKSAISRISKMPAWKGDTW